MCYTVSNVKGTRYERKEVTLKRVKGSRLDI
ncbi:hypothetical protein SAMN05216233_107217 [Desulfoluna spongiiphila]|uniref:Uncharacterized protein n=1 Tax=Desulfoluna spongiiphila TaxID=419481 RepID=A0A1G5F8L9_9BACT|nr:hypothetical protein SAMN05216233_107217 [Desulfoluna spongiiphila]